MRLHTNELWNRFWQSIRFDEYTWQNSTAFREWSYGQPEADANSNETWITKKHHNEPWGPDNCCLVNVWNNSDFNRILAGAFSARGNHESL